MADITLANSTYSTGTNDTASTLVNNVTATDAQQYNGAASAIVGIETILGTGTDLKGSTADLVARLAVEHNADGTQKNVTVAKGGTGATSFTDGAVLLGNGTAAIQALALPSGLRVLMHDGVAGSDPFWGYGLVYQGPASCGAGSTRSHEGAVTISADGNYSGVHFYSTFTLNSGVTMTIPAGSGRLVIIASTSITINGTITGAGGGLTAGAGGGSAGAGGDASGGTAQPGGGGGSALGAEVGGNGGAVLFQGLTFQAGGSGGTASGAGAAGTQLTGSSLPNNPLLCLGGAPGGGGAGYSSGGNGGAGGRGGASIILIAPAITLAATATLNTSGSTGTAGSATGGAGGGGGGAGNIYMITRSYTDSGAAFTQTGGGGGAGSTGGAAGGSGAAGVRQILIYA